jgi:plastocyanin
MNTFAKIFFSIAVLAGASSGQAATWAVKMKSISYDPKKLEVKTGDEVEWSNGSYTEHSATADEEKGFDTGMVAPKKVSKKIRFDKAGTYKYHCSMHGKSMSGEITVLDKP